MKGSECSAAKFEDLRKFRIRSLVVVAILRLPLPVELREPRARPDEAEDVDGTNSAILHIGRDFIVVQIGLTVTDVEVLQRRGGLAGDNTVDDASGQFLYPSQLELHQRVLRASCDDLRVRDVARFDIQGLERADASKSGKPSWIGDSRLSGNPQLREARKTAGSSQKGVRFYIYITQIL